MGKHLFLSICAYTVVVMATYSCVFGLVVTLTIREIHDVVFKRLCCECNCGGIVRKYKLVVPLHDRDIRCCVEPCTGVIFM